MILNASLLHLRMLCSCQWFLDRHHHETFTISKWACISNVSFMNAFFCSYLLHWTVTSLMLLMRQWSPKTNTGIAITQLFISVLFQALMILRCAAVNKSPLLPLGSDGRFPVWLRDGVICWSCGWTVKRTVSAIMSGISSHIDYT